MRPNLVFQGWLLGVSIRWRNGKAMRAPRAMTSDIWLWGAMTAERKGHGRRPSALSLPADTRGSPLKRVTTEPTTRRATPSPCKFPKGDGTSVPLCCRKAKGTSSGRQTERPGSIRDGRATPTLRAGTSGAGTLREKISFSDDTHRAPSEGTRVIGRGRLSSFGLPALFFKMPVAYPRPPRRRRGAHIMYKELPYFNWSCSIIPCVRP